MGMCCSILSMLFVSIVVCRWCVLKCLVAAPLVVKMALSQLHGLCNPSCVQVCCAMVFRWFWWLVER